jgi:hypothetical protein
VPPGTWDVVVTFGSWQTTIEDQEVLPYQSAKLPEPRCLEADSARIAVVAGAWDKIEVVLAGLGVPYDFFETDVDGIWTLVGDPTVLARYDVVFFNCGFESCTSRAIASATAARAR